MGDWSSDSQTHVATMDSGDFYHNEKSVTIDADDTVRIEHVDADGDVTVLKELEVLAGEVIDGTYMSKSALVDFLRDQVADANEQGVLFSLHEGSFAWGVLTSGAAEILRQRERASSSGVILDAGRIGPYPAIIISEHFGEPCGSRALRATWPWSSSGRWGCR